MQEKDILDFIQTMLNVASDFAITKIEKAEEQEKIVRIYFKYLPSVYKKKGDVNKVYKIYDYLPEREWQHLSWFEYKCYIICALPRYIDEDGSIKVIDIDFADSRKSYTRLFAQAIIESLQDVKVQKAVAKKFQTTPYIVNSIMDEAVNEGVKNRQLNEEVRNISLDEKAYSDGHLYATILIDTDKKCIIDMREGRTEEDTIELCKSAIVETALVQLKQVNMDMWHPYMNAISSVAPQATIIHDKFHLFKKLSEAIDKTRKQEVIDHPLLLKQKYTVLKNAENRNEKQQIAFKQINAANLKTAQVWHVRENFKTLFLLYDKAEAIHLFKEWLLQSKSLKVSFLNKVIATFERHEKGIINPFITHTTSAMHENINGRIQNVIAKAKGFKSYKRFRINMLFYFSNLNFPSH